MTTTVTAIGSYIAHFHTIECADIFWFKYNLD